jgi:histone H1/5
VAKRTPKRKTAKRAKKSAKKAPGKAKGKKKPARGARKAAKKPAAPKARRASAGTPKVEPPKDVPPMLGGVAPSKVGLDDEGEE